MRREKVDEDLEGRCESIYAFSGRQRGVFAHLKVSVATTLPVDVLCLGQSTNAWYAHVRRDNVKVEGRDGGALTGDVAFRLYFAPVTFLGHLVFPCAFESIKESIYI